MLGASVLYYLYIAFVCYVVEHTGSAANTGADSAIFDVIDAAARPFDASVLLLSVVKGVVFLYWIWVSVRLALQTLPGSVRYTAFISVMGFLVPVANIWMPLFTLIDLEEFSAVQGETPTDGFAKLPGLLTTLGLVYGGLSPVVSSMPDDISTDLAAAQAMMQTAAVFSITGILLMMVSFTFLVKVKPGQDIALAKLAAAEVANEPASLSIFGQPHNG